MTPTVLISGSSRGLGRCLVDIFAEHGFIVFAGARDPASLAALAQPRTAAGGEIIPVALDVRDLASIAAAVRAVYQRTGSLDVLINNAAINPVPEYEMPLGELDFDAIAETYDVNAIGPLRVTQSALPLLERGQRKLIVNVSSEAGSLRHSWRDRSYGYCMSKAALNMQTTILDRALRPKGFNVLALHPGWLRTDMGGPNADLDPRDAALGIYSVVERADASTPRFVQHDGREFPW